MVVVDPKLRGNGIGSLLVRHIQTRINVFSLRAEARNELARAMFVSCGFRQDGETHCGYRMVWEREPLPPPKLRASGAFALAKKRR